MQLLTRAVCCMCFLLHLLGIAIFLKGFFPLKAVYDGYSVLNDSRFDLDERCSNVEDSNSDCFLQPTFGRLVVVVVDALRADFVFPNHNESVGHFNSRIKMSFVWDQIHRNEAVAFVAKANPPTVTLPRVKAMTTGAIPGFVDIILNFDSSFLSEDNIVTQMRDHGRRLLFYGDDTWLRLFPRHFLRSDGTTSFFVSDYTEVDNNVTRHLEDELRRDDWDVMILHYLGLDHIGHLASPSSPLVGPKLQEMDDVINKLHSTFIQQDESRDLPTLLVLCGDHGMSDQGSHGGSTTSEVLTPLVFMSSLYSNGKGVKFSGGGVNQIDVAPTLSLLLGIPIPRGNVGVFAPEALSHFDIDQKLKAAFINAKQLMKAGARNLPDFEQGALHAQLHQAKLSHERWLSLNHSSMTADKMGRKIFTDYVEAMRLLQDVLMSSFSQYDLLAMSSGILLLSLVFVTVLINFWFGPTEFNLDGYRRLVLGIACAVALLMHLAICTSPNCSASMCNGFFLVVSCAVLVTAVFFCMSSFLSVTPSVWQRAKEISCHRRISLLNLWPGAILQSVSLWSSSFVEEEHQTWYFLTVTVLLVIAGYFAITYCTSSTARGYLAFQNGLDLSNCCNEEEQFIEADFYQKQVSGRSSISNNCRKPSTIKSEESIDIATSFHSSSLFSFLACIVCAVLCRIARSWNQTGDKWSHLPDIGDWLVRPDNKPILSIVTLLSLAMLSAATALRTRDRWTGFLFLCGSIGVYCFHSARSSVIFPVIYHEILSQGVTEARVVFAIVCVLGVRTAIKMKQTSHSSEKAANSRRSVHGAVQDSDHSLDMNRKQTGGENYKQRQFGIEATFLESVWSDLRVTSTLVMMLLMRVHSLMLVAIITMQSDCLRLVVRRLGPRLTCTSVALLYLWMGQAAFFYQGNSNSLASVDMSAGHIGLESYSPVLAAVQIAFATYAGPIFWILALMEVISVRRDEQSTISNRPKYGRVTCVLATMILSRLLVLIPYLMVIFVQRYHLFVWTVFSPKLLFEGVYSLVCSFMAVFITAVTALIVVR